MSISRIPSAFLALTFAVLPLAASAQSAPVSPAPAAPAHRHNGYMHALRSLSLTQDQRTQIMALAKQTRDANRNADPETKKANGRKLRDQVRALLTPDQREQLKAALKAQRAKS